MLPQPAWRLGLGGLDPREEQLAFLRADLRGAPYAIPVRAGVAAILGLVTGGALYREAIRHLGPTDALGALVIAVIASGGIAWGAFRIGVRPADIYSAGARLLWCKLCVCCGYDLENLKPETDGCTVCPECGAAWDLRSHVAATNQQDPQLSQRPPPQPPVEPPVEPDEA